MQSKVAKKSESRAVRHLYLMRHCQAISKDTPISDRERPLTPKGVRDGETVAVHVRELKLAFDLFISSPATRALQTARIFSSKLGYPESRIEIENWLYDDKLLAGVIAGVRACNNDYESIALFGHNPMFENLAHYLIPEFHRNVPKSSVIGIAMSIASWAQVREGSGTLDLYVSPKILNAAAVEDD